MVGRLAVLLAGAAVLQIAGRGLDGLWHANHDEFEAARQQLEAHWLLWIAVVATLVIAAVALRRPGLGQDVRTGLHVTLWSGVAYSAVAIWHFVEHANHNDPAVAHVLLAIGQILMLIGIVLTVARARRIAPPATRQREA